MAVTMPLVPSHLEKELAAMLGRPEGFLTTSAEMERRAFSVQATHRIKDKRTRLRVAARGRR
jgi:hypothetical protein